MRKNVEPKIYTGINNLKLIKTFTIACLCIDKTWNKYTIVQLKRKRKRFIGICKECKTIYWFKYTDVYEQEQEEEVGL